MIKELGILRESIASAAYVLIDSLPGARTEGRSMAIGGCPLAAIMELQAFPAFAPRLGRIVILAPTRTRTQMIEELKGSSMS